jgi:hypothetical protein
MNIFISWCGAVASILGAVASFIGAGIAICQARNAKKSADIACETMQHLRGHTKISELAKLQYSCQDTIKAMEKYGSSSPASLAGVDTKRDAEAVQSFITLLSEQKNYFMAPDSNTAELLIRRLVEILPRFAGVCDAHGAQPFGREILSELNWFSSIIKTKTDKHHDTLS